MELYGLAHYCNGPILIKLRSPDRAANMFFTVKDKFPSYTVYLLCPHRSFEWMAVNMSPLLANSMV